MIIFVNETSQTAAMLGDLELHSLLPAIKNREQPVEYVGQVLCVCVCVCKKEALLFLCLCNRQS